MADTTNSIREYNRDAWTLGDLRQIINDTAGWDAGAAVFLTAPQTKCAYGTVEVVAAE